MHGVFNAMVIDDLGQGDAPFLEAIKNHDIDGLLKRHPIPEKAVGVQNQIYQTALQWWFWAVFGLPSIGTYNAIGDGGLRCVVLSKLSSEPAYADLSGTFYWRDDSMAADSAHLWSNPYTLLKRFWSDRSEPSRIWSDQNREGYYYRDRFLWLPSNGVFSDIRSILAYFSQTPEWTGTSSSDHRQKWSATRLKDSGGNPITLQKSASQGFLVEYTIKLFSR